MGVQRRLRWLAMGAAFASVSVLLAPASAAELGFNRVLRANESSTWSTGYGPGWVALTFDTGGHPHGPIVGVLFAAGVAGQSSTAHMDVYHTHGPAASVPGPFSGGYAGGNFSGCAWAYSAAKLTKDGPHHSEPCTTPASHTAQIFCTDPRVSHLCNDGRTTKEPEAGVWKDIGAHQATIGAGGCDAYGNVGADAIYHSGAPAWKNLIRHVGSGTVKVRYVTKGPDHAVMALFKDGVLQNHLRWAFVKLGCLHQ